MCIGLCEDESSGGVSRDDWTAWLVMARIATTTERRPAEETCHHQDLRVCQRYQDCQEPSQSRHRLGPCRIGFEAWWSCQGLAESRSDTV